MLDETAAALPPFQANRHSIKATREARRDMVTSGFCHLRGDEFALTEDQRAELMTVQDHFSDLPLDPYDPDANRYRQLGRYVLLPFIDMLVPRPENKPVYRQNKALNEEASGLARRFESIPERLLGSGFVRALIMHDFRNSPFDESLLSVPIEVGVHFVRLKAEPGKPGVSTPNRLHKDGEPFTWIHLISRTAVTGGENVITDNTQLRVLCDTTLASPLDTIGIVDDQVWHQVKPVFVDAHARTGHRDVMLIDFTPMVAAPSEPPVRP